MPWKHIGEGEVQLHSYTTSALEGCEWSMPCPSHFTAGKETQYPLFRRLGRPCGRSEQVWKISPPPGFEEPQTIQPVASRYTDYAILATSSLVRQPEKNMAPHIRYPWQWIIFSNLCHNLRCLFLAIIIQMGHDILDSLKDYWSTTEQFTTTFNNTITSTSFLHIS